MSQRTTQSYIYEGIVIVASILVAFGLDASWDNYQESRVEQRILAELQGEFEQAKSRIEDSVAELEAAIDASVALANYIGMGKEVLAPDVAAILVDQALSINTLEVPSGVLDSIIASGQVRLISNGMIRNALAQWPAFVADVRENHEWHRVDTDEYLVPYLARYVSIRESNSMLQNRSELAPDTFDYDLASMQNDPVFRGRLLWRVVRQSATLRESRVLLAETDSLLALITAEID